MAFIEINQEGIVADSYDEILGTIKRQFKFIFGQDIYITSDSKDGQLLALFALSISDNVDSIVEAYNSFSPTTAYGAALDTNVAINGIHREKASTSVCDVMLTGDIGTIINNGIVADSNNQQWLLPSEVVIPTSGNVVVTASAKDDGPIFSLPNSITKIITPTRGWLSVNNISSPTVGRPIETDPELRIRQRNSTALTSVTSFDGLLSSISKIKNIGAFKLYENDTNLTDSNTLPPHSISLVVNGGDSSDIGKTLLNKKGQGVSTYGTTTVNVIGFTGEQKSINFFRPIFANIGVKITLQALSGYSSKIGQEIQQKVSNYINSLGIGKNVLITKLYLPSNLCGDIKNTIYFDLISVEVNRDAGAFSATNLIIAFNELAKCTPSDVQLTVQS